MAGPPDTGKVTGLAACTQTRKQETGVARHRRHLPVISEVRSLRKRESGWDGEF